MIKNIVLTGDTHSSVRPRLEKLAFFYPEFEPEETAVIILGDVGLNFYKDSREAKNKKVVNATGYQIYAVYGNHEDRPDNIEGMVSKWDAFTNCFVWYQEEYPNIHYFPIWTTGNIMNHSLLVIGGAYSVDKEYRLEKGWSWFKDEQMTEKERNDCMLRLKEGYHKYDITLAHTCPLEWMPTDLFLPMVNQTKVDKSTEMFLSEVRREVDLGQFFCGHYHADRTLDFNAHMLYEDLWVLADDGEWIGGD